MKEVKIGEVSINADYFGNMEKKQALKELIEMQSNPGSDNKGKEEFATKAFDAAVAEVKK